MGQGLRVGGIKGVFTWCRGVSGGVQGVFFVSETAQVELRSGRSISPWPAGMMIADIVEAATKQR